MRLHILIIQLMNSTDYYLNKQLVQYVSSCLEMGDNLLSKAWYCYLIYLLLLLKCFCNTITLFYGHANEARCCCLSIVFTLTLPKFKTFRHTVRLFLVKSLKQLLPHLLDMLKFILSKWLAILDLHCTGEAYLVLMNLFGKKTHITLRSCLLALCFDPATLIEIAIQTESEWLIPLLTSIKNPFEKMLDFIATFSVV